MSILASATALGFYLLTTTAALADEQEGEPRTEEQKIEWLIERIGSLEGAVFIRNGKEHNATEAADHLRQKWNSARKKIKTADDFIEHLASRSSLSGRPYRIRFQDGKEVESGEWLKGELASLDKEA